MQVKEALEIHKEQGNKRLHAHFIRFFKKFVIGTIDEIIYYPDLSMNYQ